MSSGFSRYFEEDGTPKFNSLGTFRITRVAEYRAWYTSKFMYHPNAETNVVYHCYKRYTYCGEVVMTLVAKGKAAVTVIPRSCLEEV